MTTAVWDYLRRAGTFKRRCSLPITRKPSVSRSQRSNKPRVQSLLMLQSNIARSKRNTTARVAAERDPLTQDGNPAEPLIAQVQETEKAAKTSESAAKHAVGGAMPYLSSPVMQHAPSMAMSVPVQLVSIDKVVVPTQHPWVMQTVACPEQRVAVVPMSPRMRATSQLAVQAVDKRFRSRSFSAYSPPQAQDAPGVDLDRTVSSSRAHTIPGDRSRSHHIQRPLTISQMQWSPPSPAPVPPLPPTPALPHNLPLPPSPSPSPKPESSATPAFSRQVAAPPSSLPPPPPVEALPLDDFVVDGDGDGDGEGGYHTPTVEPSSELVAASPALSSPVDLSMASLSLNPVEMWKALNASLQASKSKLLQDSAK
ncbi:hypothetical protein RI367_005110 [Sorochytrium milnesiophthora]